MVRGLHYTLIISVYPPMQSVNYPVPGLLTLWSLGWRMWLIAMQ